jgi:hypothetical protein
MAKKLLLCASTFHISAALWSGRRLIGCRGFEDDDAGHAAFQNLLRSTAGVPVYLMADTVDEDYRFETLPHASGSDRREMLDRKLKQLYRSTPFYGSQLQEREGDKRRDDRYLFAALTNPEIFSPWLQFLLAAKAPVAGVFPLPMLSLGLAERLGLQDPNVLLVSKHNAGVRQTFLKERRFRISRLTPARAGDQSAQDYYAEEIRNTRMYLDALNVTHVEDVVTVVVVDGDGSMQTLGERIVRGRQNLRWIGVGQQELTGRIGVDRASLEASEDALHLHLLGLQTPGINLAPPTLTAGYSRYRASRAIYLASAAAAVVGMTWAGVNLYRALDLKGQQRDTLAQSQAQQAKYQEQTRSYPPSPLPPARLKQTVEVARQIQASARLPDQLFGLVSRAMDMNPEIGLTGLTWHHGRQGVPAGSPPGQLVQSAQLQLQLTAKPSDQKTVLATINKFVKDLGLSEQVASARTVKLPVNLASSAKLIGSTANPRREQPQLAPFEVELVLKSGV